VSILVGSLVNMIFEYSKADGIPAAMALKTFTERLAASLDKVEDKEKKMNVGDGIVRGLNQVADPALATREFAPVSHLSGYHNGSDVSLLIESTNRWFIEKL